MIDDSKIQIQFPNTASRLPPPTSRCRCLHTHLARNHRRPSAFTPSLIPSGFTSSPIPCLNSHPVVVVRRLDGLWPDYNDVSWPSCCSGPALWFIGHTYQLKKNK
ncbi:hypothetical protein LXL04_004082 [Taraxacum kok-saghyz]